ncbi:DNA polymerase III subunit chi [Methylophilus aquaticus]|uniref:DNA polymerase III subunit chi n=1 Tax=Methylophilus aquaticus TaxID=1971610 RepID=A0ABT9JRE1_9PROT|nr:DNA polymerase III subunit chi [Methylophilus aquaticus]MDP8567059.1 DNA polymerase III subunit chi [Methylophilus aquaticus]
MTKIRFYTDVADPIVLIRHLAEQALTRQRRVTVYVRDQLHASTLADALWQQPGPSFMPNALADDSHAAYTPLLFAWQPAQIQQDDLLFNCQPEQPTFFSRFRHLFEIIGSDAAEKAAGRQRYAFYRDRGYDIQHIKAPPA